MPDNEKCDDDDDCPGGEHLHVHCGCGYKYSMPPADASDTSEDLSPGEQEPHATKFLYR